MDRPTADDDVAVAEPPSTSGAHWASRDNDSLYRRPGGHTPFRRPPAVNSLSDQEQPGPSFPPESTETRDGGGWFDAGTPGGDAEKPVEPERPAPEYGPAPPATPGRVSFGVTAGPISPSGRLAATPDAPVSPPRERPASVPRQQTPAGPMPPRGRPVSPPYGFPGPDGRFGDVIGSPSREIRPHRAARRDSFEGGPPRGAPRVAAPARRSRTVMIAAIVLTAVVLVAGAAAGVMLLSGSDRSLDSLLKAGGSAAERTATAPIGGRTGASFELVAATTTLTLKTQDLGRDLYRITSAEGSGTVPSPVLAGDRVQLHLVPDGKGATGKVSVTLSTKVKWTLRFVGGADEQIVDLRGGRVGSIDVLGAARRLQLALPVPAGTVPIRITGAVEDLSITSPADNPVRVRLDSGAKTVVAGDRTLRDVEPGSTLTPKGWQVRNRYDVDAASRIALLSVHPR